MSLKYNLELQERESITEDKAVELENHVKMYYVKKTTPLSTLEAKYTTNLDFVVTFDHHTTNKHQVLIFRTDSQTDIEGVKGNLDFLHKQFEYVADLDEGSKKLLDKYIYQSDYTTFTPEEYVRLDSIILQSPPVEHPLVVWRGGELLFDTTSPGIFSTNRCVSTTLDVNNARKFQSMNGGGLHSFQLDVGMKALGVHYVTNWEKELILSSETSFVSGGHSVSFTCQMIEDPFGA